MKEKTISLLKVNLLLIPFACFVIGCVLALYYLVFGSLDIIAEKFNVYIAGVLFLVFICVHELIHGIYYAKYAKGGFRSIRFGIMWRGLAPYCNCLELIRVQQFRIAILMPTVILGFIPLIIGFILRETNVIFFSTAFIIAGLGDFIYLWMLRDFNKEVMVMDHPKKAGFVYHEDQQTTNI
jgi:hypothetical protein